MPETSPSVLVIRLDGIGDALALAPLLAAFASAGIPVDAVFCAANAAVFTPKAVRHVDIARWHLRSSSAEDSAAVRAFGRELAERRYTHVLVATEDPSGYRLAEAAGIPNRIGFDNGWGKPLKTVWVRSLLTRTIYRAAGLDRDKHHECEVLFQLANGLVPESMPTTDPGRLRPLLLAGVPVADARVAFQVTDKWERLGLSLAQVAVAFRAARAVADVVPIASATEPKYAAAFESITETRVERFDTVPSWEAAIASHRAIVAPDSGAVHVGGTVGTPVVAVFPEADFDLQVARWHPWAAPYRAIRAAGEWPQNVGADLAALLETSGTR
jgi:ADP-heptose:LPS heptosyltransferase